MQASEANGQRVEMVVSIDGCHIGPRFDHDFNVDKPFLAGTQTWEELLWSYAEQGDFAGFLQFLYQDHNLRYFDGVGALALVMSMFGKSPKIQRTGYAQWFTNEDHSAVTFSSGKIAE